MLGQTLVPFFGYTVTMNGFREVALAKHASLRTNRSTSPYAPRHDNEALFVQTVSDYPLVEAFQQSSSSFQCVSINHHGIRLGP